MENLSIVCKLMNSAHNILNAAAEMLNKETDEPGWSIYMQISNLASTTWSTRRIIENLKK